MATSYHVFCNDRTVCCLLAVRKWRGMQHSNIFEGKVLPAVDSSQYQPYRETIYIWSQDHERSSGDHNDKSLSILHCSEWHRSQTRRGNSAGRAWKKMQNSYKQVTLPRKQWKPKSNERRRITQWRPSSMAYCTTNRATYISTPP